MGILSALCAILGCKSAGEGYASLGVEEYAKAIEDTSVIRLDVRTAEEFAQGHIPGAINIDVKQSDFAAKAEAVLPHGHTIAVNCRSGMRSKLAAATLLRKGFKVIELDKGFIIWEEKGMPTTTK